MYLHQDLNKHSKKSASRAVASTVSSVLGIDESTIKRMMPMVASLAMGSLAKQRRQANIAPEQATQSPADILGQVTQMFGVQNAGDLLGKLLS